MRYLVIATAACFSLMTCPALSEQETVRPDERLARDIGQEEREMRDLRKAQCMKAIGAEEFCSCIADESPTGIDFVDYVRIVLSRSEPVSADDKAVVGALKDKCVSLSSVSCSP